MDFGHPLVQSVALPLVTALAATAVIRFALGREEPEFTWEATDKALALKQAA